MSSARDGLLRQMFQALLNIRQHHVQIAEEYGEPDDGGGQVEKGSGSRSWLCNSERLQGGRRSKYVQFQQQVRGTRSARKVLWTGICYAHSPRRGLNSLVVAKRQGMRA